LSSQVIVMLVPGFSAKPRHEALLKLAVIASLAGWTLVPPSVQVGEDAILACASMVTLCGVAVNPGVSAASRVPVHDTMTLAEAGKATRRPNSKKTGPTIFLAME